MRWPKYAIGYSTGWIYLLQEDRIFDQGAFYKTEQPNGVFEILFCWDNFKEDKNKKKVIPAVLYYHYDSILKSYGYHESDPDYMRLLGHLKSFHKGGFYGPLY